MDISDSTSIVVHTNQPKGKMVKVLFEPNAKLSDSLTYDITAWSIPYAYGLDAIASTSKISSVKKEEEQKVSGNLKNAYGFVSKWSAVDDAIFLADLLKHNFRVRFTEKPFTSNGNQFDRGSLIITKGDNLHIDNFTEVLNTIKKRNNRNLFTITSGFSQKTPDIGSPDIKLINKQKVAVLSGDYTSSLSYGEIWYFFEKELNYPLTSINTDNLGSTNLSKYDVIILPNGSYGSLFNKSTKEKLDDWVAQGGKLITIGSAMRSFANRDGYTLKRKQTDSSNDETNLVPYAEQERAFVNQLITGAIFKTKVDNTHPMAFGYSKDFFTLKIGSTFYDLLDRGYNVSYLNDNKVYSGFAGKDAQLRISNSLVFGEERKGSGSIIYFADNVLFRNFWDNGKLFLVNSIFFVNNTSFRL